MSILSERLSALRKSKNLSQAELGKVFRLGQSTIAMYETDKRIPDPSTLKRFADYYNVSIDYLLGRTDKATLSQFDEESHLDPEAYEYRAKTLADALTELSELHFKYNFDEDMMIRLVRKAISKYGPPKPVITEPAAHGPGYPGSGVFDKKGTGKGKKKDDKH